MEAQRVRVSPEYEPGRDQRTGRSGHEPARAGFFSLIVIDAVPANPSLSASEPELQQNARCLEGGLRVAVFLRAKGCRLTAQEMCGEREKATGKRGPSLTRQSRLVESRGCRKRVGAVDPHLDLPPGAAQLYRHREDLGFVVG